MLRRGPIELHPYSTLRGTGTAPDVPPATLGHLREVASWVEAFLLSSHPQIGRMGPVCPWCPTSVENDLFWIACVEHGSLEPRELVEAIHGLRDLWLETAPRAGRLVQNKTFVIALPGSSSRGDEVLALQRELKPYFLAGGLMLGEFFAQNDKGGVRNDDFLPLRSPVPLLVVRDMVPIDVGFLADDAAFPAFLAKFGDDAPKHVASALYPRGKPFSPRMMRRVLDTAVAHRDALGPTFADVDVPTGFYERPRFLAEAERRLAEDRSFRPLFAGARVKVEISPSPEAILTPEQHCYLRWHLGHLVRTLVRVDDTIGLDEDGILVLLGVDSALGVRRLEQRARSVFSTSTIHVPPHVFQFRLTGMSVAVEGVRNPTEDEWEWDGTVSTTAPQLLAAMQPVPSVAQR